jgi:tocopherol O-methyltransferase
MFLKDQIIRHYDELSPFYKDVWGIHIHHGYWDTGTETKEEAQAQLVRELACRARLGRGCRILDLGCGLGGSALLLNKILDASVTGITISQVQVEIGNALAARYGADVRLLRMDAERLEMDDRFDVVWSVEAISHLSNKADCFRSVSRLLNRGGTLVIADWFRSPTATAAQELEFLEPIERAMLVPKLEAPCTYIHQICRAGIQVTWFEDLSDMVSKTWDVAIELVRNPVLWKLVATRGKEFFAFLEGFRAMKAGYRSKALIYGALVGHKL